MARAVPGLHVGYHSSVRYIETHLVACDSGSADPSVVFLVFPCRLITLRSQYFSIHYSTLYSVVPRCGFPVWHRPASTTCCAITALHILLCTYCFAQTALHTLLCSNCVGNTALHTQLCICCCAHTVVDNVVRYNLQNPARTLQPWHV